MQVQLPGNVSFQQARGKELIQRPAYGERGSNSSLSQRHNSEYHRIGNANCTHPAESSFTEYSTEREESAKDSTKPPKIHRHRLGFSYLALSFHLILRKVKAFYNGFLGCVASESEVGSEAPMVEPYFSIPVLPHP